MRGVVYARSKAQEAGYGLETELAEPDGALVSGAAAAMQSLEALQKPLAALARRLEAVLEDAPDWLDSQARARVEGAIRGLSWRRETLAAWIALLARIGGEADPEFVDWLAVERIDGRELDVAIHRRWLDPTKPLAATVLAPADGVLVTSATLRGGEEWAAAEARTGAAHLALPARAVRGRKPVRLCGCSEVLIVTDVKQGDIASLAGAYARLIEAANGGTLGLFTAIQRLKAVHARIADRLARAGLPLLAQHVDPIDAGTLSTSSATIRGPRCSAPMRCATESTCPANRFGWWSWSGCLGRGRRCFTRRGGWPAAEAPTTTASCAPGWRRRSAGLSAGRAIAALRDSLRGDAVAAAQGVSAWCADLAAPARRSDRARRAASGRRSRCGVGTRLILERVGETVAQRDQAEHVNAACLATIH